ncbi:FBP domain-containing protein [Microbacterium sp. BH-3-3-3]|uniref:FBP domain-containing protein n=1 Tax=Microbacterium sp. BH-3-3-3 TaxID=1906742 RepID=UPI00089284B9|nr:FBP domain-containing protein [Microbacterium sp. BH-3-3-3]AOX45428.1 translation elongation factor [Microbacterium sp. BH-3-3-3]
MHALSASTLRSAFVNVSTRERSALTVPTDIDTSPWDRLDYVGWRDAKSPLLGFVVAEIDGTPVGLQLRQTEQRTRTRAQCSWCTDVTLPNDVVLFSARRTGKAGRAGNTVGTLLCAGFECSRNVRRLDPPAYLGHDAAAARDRRVASLRSHVDAFFRDLRDGV